MTTVSVNTYIPIPQCECKTDEYDTILKTIKQAL